MINTYESFIYRMTRDLTVTLRDTQGIILKGAVVKASLVNSKGGISFGSTDDGIVVPATVSSTSNDSGVAVLSLIPSGQITNAVGY